MKSSDDFELHPLLLKELKRVHEELLANGELHSPEALQGFYATFRERFGPEVLRAQDGEALLSLMHETTHEGMVYWLEFKKGDEFPAIFGSISGGSALKFGLYRSKKTRKWTTGAPKAPQTITTQEAVAIARRNRDQLVAASELLAALPKGSSAEAYAKLQEELARVAPDVQDSSWGHKYLALIHPNKLDDYHALSYQRFHLVKLLQEPATTEGRYANASRYMALAAALQWPMNHVSTVLNQRNGRPYSYWRIGTRDGDGGASHWDRMRRESIVAVGWPRLEDLTAAVATDEFKDIVRERLAQTYPAAPNVIGQTAQQLRYFCKDVSEGDYVLACDGATVLGIGRITGPYRYSAGEDFPHKRSVDWLDFGEWRLPTQEGLRTTVHKCGKHFDNLVAVERRVLEPKLPPTAWDAYLATAKEKYEEIERAEHYKTDLGKALAKARQALLHDGEDWPKLVVAAIKHNKNNLIHWQAQSPLAKWIDSNADEARDALSGIWTSDDRTPGERVRSFDGKLPEHVFSRQAKSTRLDVASYFMMGIDPQRYPPYRQGAFQVTYRKLDYPESAASDAGGEYEHALDFLDRLLEEARKRGINQPNTRLDAQSIVWWSREDKPVDPPPPTTSVRSAHALNTILYGPPGTGKTWRTVTRAVAIIENRSMNKVEQEDRAAVKKRFDEQRREGHIEMVTFHQNTTYEDFVEGIRPVLTDAGGIGTDAPARAGDVRYELSRGVFRRIVARAERDPNQPYVLIIDEINRGNVARIFGELITLIEDSKRIGRDDEARVTLPGSRTDFGVPANLYVVGTMNTADRSIALLDTALRRRFVFEEIMPDASHPDVSPDVGGVDGRKLLNAMNRRITVLLDREHQIGHTYFLRVNALESLADTFQTRIMPLLQEYFYDDWEKIGAVLNHNGFVRKLDPPAELVGSDLVDASRAVYELLPANDTRWTAATAYQAIYDTKMPAEGDSAAQDG